VFISAYYDAAIRFHSLVIIRGSTRQCNPCQGPTAYAALFLLLHLAFNCPAPQILLHIRKAPPPLPISLHIIFCMQRRFQLFHAWLAAYLALSSLCAFALAFDCRVSIDSPQVQSLRPPLLPPSPSFSP
jgi:hypothetical protein